MPDNSALASTTNLLHPRQVEEMRGLKAQKEGLLAQPGYIRQQIADPNAILKDIRDIDRVLDREAPKPYTARDELDSAIKLEGELRSAWLDGMPTQTEMRRNPPGAVDKHRLWESKHKTDVLTWKHVRRRLHASGVSDSGLSDESDVSNVEKFRPGTHSGQMTMDGAQIPQVRTIFQAPPGAAPAVVFDDGDITTLSGLDPELADNLAFLDNDQRAKLKAILDQARETPAAEPVAEKPRGPGRPRKVPQEG